MLHGSIDIKDAYYSFPIRLSDRKFLCFKWGSELYQFTCLPNGLSSAPRKFIKMLKVPLATLHRQGYISLGHIDDFYLQGQNYESCVHNVIYTIIPFTKLGLITHPDKSNFIPSQVINGPWLHAQLQNYDSETNKGKSYTVEA